MVQNVGEEQLQSLVHGNSEANRTKWALEWKKQGKKVIGTTCPYIPEEIIYAAGMLPWRITGSWQANTNRASVYRPLSTGLYYNHVLESLMAGDLEFLDGLIATNRYDDSRRFWDLVDYLKKPAYSHIMYIPNQVSELGHSEFRKSMSTLIAGLENLAGIKIADDAIVEAIQVYNRTRDLLTSLYELRKKENPPVTGAEVLGITLSAAIMPKDRFNHELEALLPYLEQRKASIQHSRPRLLVSGDMLDNPAYLELVESVGGVVAMDDLDTGSRYFRHNVDTSKPPLYALAERYMSGPACARMLTWEEQLDQLVGWVREFNIDGVIQFAQLYYFPREFRTPYFTQRLTDAGIPNTSIKVEYHFASSGQLRTRIGAFGEMVKDQSEIATGKQMK